MSDSTTTSARPVSPVRDNNEDAEPRLADAPALCLSGGGYRAMLFHVGALWRMREAGELARVVHFSSVSGGSVTAGLLGLRWKELAFGAAGEEQRFSDLIVTPLRELAGTTVDAWAVGLGAVSPFHTIADEVRKALREKLYGKATLQDLPDVPVFLINATNVQSGSLWRFTKKFMRDYKVGQMKDPSTQIAVAVACSAAFPPVLSPQVLELQDGEFEDRGPLGFPPYTTRIVLTDGGVYDNLGMETAWKRFKKVLVSDGGQKLGAELSPSEDWARHSVRVLNVIDDQVRNLRKKQLIGSFVAKEREGAYWGIRTNIADYQVETEWLVPHDTSLKLADTPTRLGALEPEQQERLINWGYAVSDAALRRHYVPKLPKATKLPYPASGFG